MVRENLPQYKRVVESVVSHATAIVNGNAPYHGGDVATAPKLSFNLETKAPYRIIEQSLINGPNKEYPDVSKVLDVATCLIECADYNIAGAVVAAFGAKHDNSELDISSVNVRLTKGQTSCGWRDVMLYIVINNIIFEVQIVLTAMLDAREMVGARNAYNQFRFFVSVFASLDLELGLNTAMKALPAAVVQTTTATPAGGNTPTRSVTG